MAMDAAEVDTFEASDALDLLDRKRHIFTLYAEVRAAEHPEDAWQSWQDVRERLYRTPSETHG
jgi:hypothetical protein